MKHYIRPNRMKWSEAVSLNTILTLQHFPFRYGTGCNGHSQTPTITHNIFTYRRLTSIKQILTLFHFKLNMFKMYY